ILGSCSMEAQPPGTLQDQVIAAKEITMTSQLSPFMMQPRV
ncbi:hypothetical protein MTO96_027944, partial [Rhipicephalus appendiculatus]